MNLCARHLKKLISINGPLSVDRYMAECLYHPVYGFYRTQNPIGKEGHFITAPEISSLFGEIIGLWAVSQWELMGKPKRFWLCEFGPGRGTLFQDMLRAAKIRPAFLKAAQYCFLELDGHLKKQQQEKFASLFPIFIDSVDQIPEKSPFFLIMNEFFDALPIKQFQKTLHGWKERYIDFSDQTGTFFFTLAPISLPDPISDSFDPDPPEGYIAEMSPVSESYAHSISEKMQKQGGAALILDYGFKKKYTNSYFGSLQAVHRHQKINPFALPGESDLSAHVDFHHLKRIFSKKDLHCDDIIPQGSFLENLGIHLLAEKRKKDTTSKQKTMIDEAVARLTAPDQMGALFQALTLHSRF